jgi:uncharacterized protein (DUF697 family)
LLTFVKGKATQSAIGVTIIFKETRPYLEKDEVPLMPDTKDTLQTTPAKRITKTKADLAEEVEMQTLLIDKLEAKLKETEQLKSVIKERNVLNDYLVKKLMDAEQELASNSSDSKHLTAQNIITNHMAAGAGLALIPVPLFDLGALTGTHLSLLRSLSNNYDVDYDKQKGKALLTSLVGGSVPVLIVMGLGSFAKLIPGIGTIGGGISMTILSGSLIYATGQVFARHFEQGGTLSNFESKQWKEYFTEQFEKMKSEMKLAKETGAENKDKEVVPA